MKIKFKYITEEELAKLKPEKKAGSLEIPIPKTILKKILLFIIIAGFLLNQYLWLRMDYFSIITKLFNINISIMKK